MKIELKKFYSNERFSQETLCFQAEVHVDGVRVGTVENTGNGGAHNLHVPDAQMLQRMIQHIKALPALPPMPDQGIDAEIPMTVDLYFSIHAEKHAKAKSDKAAAKRHARFARSAHTRGFKAFVARLGAKHHYSEILFEARSLAEAQGAVTTLEKKHKKGCFFMDEVAP